MFKLGQLVWKRCGRVGGGAAGGTCEARLWDMVRGNGADGGETIAAGIRALVRLGVDGAALGCAWRCCIWLLFGCSVVSVGFRVGGLSGGRLSASHVKVVWIDHDRYSSTMDIVSLGDDEGGSSSNMNGVA